MKSEITSQLSCSPNSNNVEERELNENDLANVIELSEILPNFTNETNDGYFGCVDVFDQTGVSGWCLNAKTHEPQLIKISLNGICIGSTTTTIHRPDLSRLVNFQIYCGFKFTWDSISHEIFADLKLLISNQYEVNFDLICNESNRLLSQHTPCKVLTSEFLKWITQPILKLPNLDNTEKFLRTTATNFANSRLKNVDLIATDSSGFSHENQIKVNFLGLINRTLYGQFDIRQSTGVKVLSLSDFNILIDNKVLVDGKIELLDKEFEPGKHCFIVNLGPEILDGCIRKVDMFEKNGSFPLNASPFYIGENKFDCQIKCHGGGKVLGYILERVSSPRSLSGAYLRVDQINEFGITCDKPVFSPFLSEQVCQKGGFEFQLPDRFLSNKPVKIELIHEGQVRGIAYSVFTPRGNIDYINREELVGWIYDAAVDVEYSYLDLDFYLDGQLIQTARANLSRDDVGRPCGFCVKLEEFSAGKPIVQIAIMLKGTAVALLDTPVVYGRNDGMIEILRGLSERARAGTLGLNESESSLLSSYLNRKLIQDLRMASECQVVKINEKKSKLPVNVIVPVYDGFEETLRCLESLVLSKDQNVIQFDIVLIDDCGPNENIPSLLKVYSDRPDVTLIVNEQNMGFVRSVNKALVLSRGKDVVLLNADAVVNGDWLDRLSFAAYSSASVASVTPFSNNATVCSYPDPHFENSMPSDLSLAEIDEICKKQNAGKTVSIPSGIGFCMYMRADAIKEVGLLDAEKFGMGYGEENDWCIRARDLGWKHLHACDTFVEHIGGVSFGKEKKSGLVEKNLRVLADTYPEYTPLVMDFLRKDPAKIFRNKITFARIQSRIANSKGARLLITHPFGGGIEVFCRDLSKRLFAENVAVITLESLPLDKMLIKFQELEACYELTDFRYLIEDLKFLAISEVHFNSDIGFDECAWNIPRLLDVPYDITIHDYTPVCPRVNFTTPSGNYCGEPKNVVSCNRCIKSNGTYPYLEKRFLNLGEDVQLWRSFYKEKFVSARHVFTPNRDVTTRIHSYIPDVELITRPHPNDAEKENISLPNLHAESIMNVAVIGAIGYHKGYNILRACVENAFQAGLPLQFTVVGYTCDDECLKKYPNVTITGKYSNDRLPEIINECNAHIALFVSPWPETYSYTLTEAINAGLWPVSLPIGAQAERIRGYGFGSVLSNNLDARGINLELMALRMRAIQQFE